MKQILLVFTIVLIGSNVGFGQTNDTIEVKKVFGGYKYLIDETPLTMNQLTKTLEINKDAHDAIKKAKGNLTIATILSGAGGFMVGYPIGTAIGGGEPEWTMAGIGAGLILVSIPIAQKSNKQINNAVEIYNSGLITGSYYKQKPEIRLGATPNGIGIVMNF